MMATTEPTVSEWPSVADVERAFAIADLGCDTAKRLCAIALRVQTASYERGTWEDMKRADAMVRSALDQYARASAQARR